ncbi:DNA repair protein RecN [Ornithinibacillus bavariensis]|uniref:DNA repair protein RecN n=1 Tax=Ornithinibacillus bavariensis TaxID=545502 RepID=A0A919XBE6_9BACI|nr:DNA repair protein RecN [Ornithinibacillus bavariensis]GIO28544.1 DNA repair protein RecN [Ornithinibacillus bavariensis]HAM80284.1 DNA repair protein RecN [Ornithinibacillus sp.]
MLTELAIRNFAIIDQLTITFQDGLTVLSGETGAGKSIIIDSIQLLAGGRSSVDFVRHGEEKAEIEGLFLIDSDNHPIHEVGNQYGVETRDNEIVLNRVITASGKSICRVNGKLVTLAILKEFGRTLIDIHSQHETQSLMIPENHIELLDLYNRDQIEQAKEEYLTLFQKLQSLRNRYKELNENEKEMAQRLDLLEFQLNELEKANLVPNEDIELENERKQLLNYERIFRGITEAYNALYGEEKGLELLHIAQKALEENSSFDPFIAKKSEEITNHFYMIEDLTYQLSNYMDGLEFDPNRLNEIEGRLAEIDRLKKKYGTTVSEMIEYMGKIEEEIELINNKESHLQKIMNEIEEVKQDAFLEAKQLHDLRKKAAKALIEEVHVELKDLYLEKSTFSIEFSPETPSEHVELHKNGFDQIRFLISTNLGEPLKEISKVASGGELSRIMLVLKKLFAKHQGVTSVIFDEVDTGVSGRVAQAIAEKIFQISKESQVLCITHLPQVAAMADTHLLIEKDEINNRTLTHVSVLTETEQINELSRMMTGTKLTNTAKEHAKELLDLAESFKKGQLINN